MKTTTRLATNDKQFSLPIKIKDLTKTYDDVFALDRVSLDVEAGEFLTLLGPSGSGKTTLLMAIAGFSRPTAGSICFGEKEMVLTPPHQREVGMVFQNYALFPHMSVFENVAFPLKLRKVNSVEISERVYEALKTVQLSDFPERRIDQLSGGQKQRVALARAFVFRPRILLMDEPLSALDKKLRDQMQIELKQLHRKLGVTTVYVTHDQREALTMSDRIAVINDGKISQLGTPKQIYNHPANRFVADFIGESSVLPLVCQNSNMLYFMDQLVAKLKAAETQKLWSLVIRPEMLSIVSENEINSPDCLIFCGIILEYIYQGETALVIVKLENGSMLSVRVSTSLLQQKNQVKISETISLNLDRQFVTLIPQELEK